MPDAPDFVTVNRRFWQRYDRADAAAPRGFVLVEPNPQPVIRHCNATFAAIVSQARNLRPLFVTHRANAATRELLRSYCPDALFVDTDSWPYRLRRLKAVALALWNWWRLRTPTVLLEFRIDGIRFGDIVYDDVLNGGYATVSRIDRRTLRSLAVLYWYRDVIRDILRRYQIETSVFSHTIGIASGTFARYLLRSQVEVITRLGSHQIMLKKSRTPEDLGVFPLKPESRYFDYMLRHYDAVIASHAEAYLEARLKQEVGHLSVDLAFDRRKRLYRDRESFCLDHGLDPDRKIVFVMLHAFNDFPHSHFTKPMLYRDYYEWFRRTLEVATTVTSVNWVFKEHPAAAFYTTRDLDLNHLFAGHTEPHIRFLNREADFNAASLRYLADAIATCMGTAGMEYASLGVPCVLAGESPYSGLGFTREPETVADYEQQLREIADLPRLDASQVVRARAVMYFELNLIQESPFLFCPQYEHKDIVAMTASRFWQDAAAHLSGADADALEKQVANLADFVRDANYLQYLNLEKFDFMRGAVFGE